MILRALLVMIGSVLLGSVLGGLIGFALGTFAPATYENGIYQSMPGQAPQMGLGFGVINGSIYGTIAGPAILLYDLGRRWIETRAVKGGASQ
ncbi:hypothetical protein EON79_17410 [bacterium]|nr:MAG: hypothetical protein EON79_17410 [bacterium]